MNIINVALIGVSGFAETHYQEVLRWRAKGRVRLAACTIINQDQEVEKSRYLRQIDCALFADYNEMLFTWKRKIDLCIIPTGIHLHAEMAIAALNAGCNVLLEKPIAATIQEVSEIEGAAAEAGRFVAVGFQHMYTPEIAGMKRAILDGRLGEIECIKCMGLWPRSGNYYARNNWAGRLAVKSHWVLDSPFNNAFAHWLNLLCYFAGPTLRESAVPNSVCTELYKSYPIESSDTACMRIETAENIPLFFWFTHSCENRIEPILEVRGTRGSLVLDHEKIMLRTAQGETLLMPVGNEEESKSTMYGAILDRIQGKDTLICDLSIARNQTLCANGAFGGSPIHPISAEYLTIKEEAGDLHTSIMGIADTCREAFLAEKLWSEMGVEWACAPGSANLEYYKEFSGLAQAVQIEARTVEAI